MYEISNNGRVIMTKFRWVRILHKYHSMLDLITILAEVECEFFLLLLLFMKTEVV